MTDPNDIINGELPADIWDFDFSLYILKFSRRCQHLRSDTIAEPLNLEMIILMRQSQEKIGNPALPYP